jgi:hypothetical protein
MQRLWRAVIIWSSVLSISIRIWYAPGWVEEHLGDGAKQRQDEWTGSIAVGSKPFIESVRESLGFRAKGRDVIESVRGYQLRESPASYMALFEAENEDIDPENNVFWNVKYE